MVKTEDKSRFLNTIITILQVLQDQIYQEQELLSLVMVSPEDPSEVWIKNSEKESSLATVLMMYTNNPQVLNKLITKVCHLKILCQFLFCLHLVLPICKMLALWVVEEHLSKLIPTRECQVQ